VVKVSRNAPKLSLWVPENRQLAFLQGQIFTKFLLELCSLAAGTLFQGLESWDSVGDQSRLSHYILVLWLQITITDVFWKLFTYFILNITTHPSASDSVVFLWHCALY